jgi:UPF0042 nucleotide-binding protein
MRLIVVSGLSGSGKSVALHMLEDLDWYCVDNIPAALLKSFVSHTLRSADRRYERVAVGLDARNTPEEIATVPALLAELRSSGLPCELLFVTATDEALLRRYAETRRTHPLTRGGVSLREAIEHERDLLDPVVQAASFIIDTSNTGVHELREMVRTRVERRSQPRLSLLFQSFGYKHGIPGDADYVFAFIEARIPEFVATNRRYLSVAVGCTGGQHRSVYLAEALAADFARRHEDVSVRHARLPEEGSCTHSIRQATA